MQKQTNFLLRIIKRFSHKVTSTESCSRRKAFVKFHAVHNGKMIAVPFSLVCTFLAYQVPMSGLRAEIITVLFEGSEHSFTKGMR